MSNSNFSESQMRLRHPKQSAKHTSAALPKTRHSTFSLTHLAAVSKTPSILSSMRQRLVYLCICPKTSAWPLKSSSATTQISPTPMALYTTIAKDMALPRPSHLPSLSEIKPMSISKKVVKHVTKMDVRPSLRRISLHSKRGYSKPAEESTNRNWGSMDRVPKL